jgi:pyruvate dehydrogenase E2 component (dihydrolipoamide acetyltransferase)
MPTVSIRIPQIGEGLQEARLIAVLKHPGDHIKRDEAIYQMETDKAVMDVESPHEGVLVEWLAKPDDMVPIGAEVARIEVAAAAAAPADAIAPASAGPVAIPPRTRAYAKEKGLSEAELAAVSSGSGKLMPADIDAYLASKKPEAPSRAGHQDRPVPPKQRLLNSRMVRGSQLVVPGTMSVVLDWEPIDSERKRVKRDGGDFKPSAFTMFAYAVAQAVRKHPAMKTSIIGEDTYRTYDDLSLGIAVSLPGDELVLAVVEQADSLGWFEFAQRARERIETARAGKDQANEAVTLSLTNMQSFGLRDAVPVVVSPAVATLFLGEAYEVVEIKNGAPTARKVCNLVLTFDHRVLNGVGAANFLNAVREAVGSIPTLLES